MKKHESLPWNAKSIEQLEEMLNHEASIIPNFPKHSTTMPFYNLNERERSIKAINSGKTQYALDDVSYKMNRCGFRGDWELPIEKADDELWIAALGCSFTFGEGIPVEDTWPFQVGQQLTDRGLKVRVFNFGKPGTSAAKGARYLSMFSDYMKFDYVIMLAPHLGRAEIPTTCINVWPIVINLIPNYVDNHFKHVWDSYYRFAQDEYFAYDTLRSIDHARRTTESNSGVFLASSWDQKSYDTIAEYSNATMLPFWSVKESEYLKSTDMARDGSHPGKGSNTTFAHDVVEHITALRESKE
jgi:hypothetical protein